MHGRLAQHPPDDTDFQVDYFGAGYEWFPPAVLRPTDQQRLLSRFG